jgi:hypothetical protein
VVDLVGQHAAHTVEPRQPHVRAGVRDDAHLPYRLHVGDRHEVVKHVDGVLRPGQAQPGLHRPGQARGVHLLAADDTAGVAVKEPQQPHPVVGQPLQQRRLILRARSARGPVTDHAHTPHRQPTR